MNHVSRSRADHVAIEGVHPLMRAIVIMDCFPTLHPRLMLSLDPIDCDEMESMRMKDFHWSENGSLRDVVINVCTEHVHELYVYRIPRGDIIVSMWCDLLCMRSTFGHGACIPTSPHASHRYMEPFCTLYVRCDFLACDGSGARKISGRTCDAACLWRGRGTVRLCDCTMRRGLGH